MSHLTTAKVLVISQHDGVQCSGGTLSVLTAAEQISTLCENCPVDVLVVGNQCQNVVEQLRRFPIVNQIMVADDVCFAHPLSECLAPVVVKASHGYSHILSAATTFGKDLMPRVSALLDVGQLSDITKIEAPDTVVRPIYAGNALARVTSSDKVIIMTIRETAFDKMQPSDEPTASVTMLQFDAAPSATEFVSQEMTKTERPELTSAKVVVSGGRGLGSKDNFALVEKLADKLGGAIGASRAAVDAGFVSNDLQVGQTGKVVAPDLYIAVGISGAIQHIAGMKESKVIVAINNDPDAPIFDVADYGLVGDLFALLPELIDNV
ncbi:electron transfer flavoprotein subunit alpha/FixB family protein [Vibrio japonicus]|uniref:FAD-binding protein n=1 Tax=Vibrio japonicus TaxID=1824638 RepID=A0ABY5LPE2_9VIBR|nr:FAD-binding protein [Vibrio japonicus]UUM32688.1 FAD-binding protein [Vibrio japonicus]